MGAIGGAIDYNGAIGAKARFDAAADAAALAAINKAKADVIAGEQRHMATRNASKTALSTFDAQTGSAGASQAHAPSVHVAFSGQTITATVSYQAKRDNQFARILGVSTYNFDGSATAALTMATYLNFFVALDVSASMGIPCQGYNLTRTGGGGGAPVNFCAAPGQPNCIQLRLDAVIYAIQQLLSTIQLTEAKNAIPNQFGVGLYPFIAYLRPHQPLTTNMNLVSSAAATLPSLLDNGDPNNAGGLGSGGTHFENALPALNSAITNIGDGSSANSPKPFVFLITDGAQDSQYQLGGGAWSGSNHATTLDVSNCAALKARGITVEVLYVPYVPIPNPTTIWNDEDDFANANIPNIPPALQACASPGFFFTASTPSDINSALQAMFAMALQQARLTH